MRNCFPRAPVYIVHFDNEDLIAQTLSVSQHAGFCGTLWAGRTALSSVPSYPGWLDAIVAHSPIVREKVGRHMSTLGKLGESQRVASSIWPTYRYPWIGSMHIPHGCCYSTYSSMRRQSSLFFLLFLTHVPFYFQVVAPATYCTSHEPPSA